MGKKELLERLVKDGGTVEFIMELGEMPVRTRQIFLDMQDQGYIELLDVVNSGPTREALPTGGVSITKAGMAYLRDAATVGDGKAAGPRPVQHEQS